MRIVGGQWRGRKLIAPQGSLTRPTVDRVREAIFSALTSRLGSDLANASVLDPFAGSGAMGFEALSRGAAHVTFLETDRKALAALAANIAALGATSSATVRPGSAFSLAGRLPGPPFTLILLDPPYTLDPAKVRSMLETLGEAGLVTEGTWVTWEHAAGDRADWPEGYLVDAVKKYGTTEVEFAVLERG